MMATLRASGGLLAVGLLGVALMIILPLALDLFELLQITLYAIFGILALSLAFAPLLSNALRLMPMTVLLWLLVASPARCSISNAVFRTRPHPTLLQLVLQRILD